MKTTMVLDDDLYQQAKVVAAKRGAPVASIVEEALRLYLIDPTPEADDRVHPLPTFDMGIPKVDVNDNRALWEALDEGLDADELR